MIKLTKGVTPDILVANGAAWTQILLDKKASGEVPTNTEKTRYRHPDIKDALKNETSGKCAYCESKLLHIHHGDVEHIMPKSLDLASILLWENLTLACEVCNQKKSDLDPNALHILDPYSDEPSDHLVFAGSMAVAKGTPKGISSLAILDLNRGELVERRKEKLDKLAFLIDTVTRNDLPLPARRALWADAVANDVSAASAYTAASKAFIDFMTLHLPVEVTAA